MPTIDNWRSTLMRAAINCQHTITSESVVLAQSDEQSERNALAQLVDRLAEAVKPLLDERDRLAAEVEALRADAERLDWLINATCTTQANTQGPIFRMDVQIGNIWSPRAAIDAARGIKEGGAV